ncbi:hydroxyethylthiazole kinase [Rhabdobacter roseus]|uniref:Hydroxyethylthiazole kinase n=1 Tax=Rhabdobacter roseus TaxID=1655419 RepID=A0A840TV79_9BACT|nr:hydroxyethylthiazole kinase [Rhabdobacter roseus]
MKDNLKQLLQTLRETSPLVHNITNYVVMNYTANALLAVGASPVMAHAVEEVEEMTSIAGALVVNIGTLSAPWVAGMKLAMRQAATLVKPTVLDPVGAGATSYRNQVLAELMEAAAPDLIRGNASEIMALAGLSVQTKGVDSTMSSLSSVEAARALSDRYGCVVSVSGAVDVIVDVDKMAYVANGHPIMTRVTGMGCAASALAGAFCAVEKNVFEAAIAAAATMGVCGELAASTLAASALDGQGRVLPGSFQMAFLDALASLTPEQLAEKANVRLDSKSA